MPAKGYAPQPPEFKTVWRQSSEENSRLSIKGRAGEQVGSKKHRPDPYEPQGGWMDRVKRWNTEGIRSRLFRFHRKLTHLVPASRGLSLLAYVAVLMVVLVLLVSAFFALKGGGKEEDTKKEHPKVTGQDSSPETPKTEFEIDIIVKASSLRVVSEPGGEELVASVTRGDHVTQLTGPRDGWILIRLEDGRSGYVPESLLLSPEEGD